MKQNKAIFYADDDTDDMELAMQIFAMVGLKDSIEYFSNGLELMERVQSLPSSALPALIILDYNMPKLNGLETVQALRKEDAYRDVFIIIYTTGLSKLLEEKVLEAGANACYRKESTTAETVETAKRFKAIALHGKGL